MVTSTKLKIKKNLKSLSKILSFIPLDKSFGIWEISDWTGLSRLTVRRVFHLLKRAGYLKKVTGLKCYWRNWAVTDRWNEENILTDFDFLTRRSEEESIFIKSVDKKEGKEND